MSFINPYRFGSKDAGAIPIAWYKMDELSGNTMIDEMGNYDGTNFGGIQGQAGKFGTAYRYGGTIPYSELLPSNVLIPTLTSSFTINVWLWGDIIGAGDYSERALTVFRSEFNSIIIIGFDNTNQIYAYVGGTRYYIGTTSLDEWQMVTVTYNGSVAKLYQNGVLMNTKTKVLNGSGFNVPIELSRKTIDRFAGKIDNPSFWTTALTDLEVASLFI